MNPPPGLHSAMSRDRKPFTYTPGGLDLSEIKSERMAKRLMRNAMNQGVPEVPVHPVQSPPASSTPIAVPNFNCLPVQVFPTFNLPANPKSLLRTRSNPDQSRIPTVQRVPPPSHFANNSMGPNEQQNINIPPVQREQPPSHFVNNSMKSNEQNNFNSPSVQQGPPSSHFVNNPMRPNEQPNINIPPVQREQPPSHFVNNSMRPNEQNNINKYTPPSPQINNNRPYSMYEYSSPSNNTQTLPRNYGSQGYTQPILPEISYDAEYFQVAPKNSNLGNAAISIGFQSESDKVQPRVESFYPENQIEITPPHFESIQPKEDNVNINSEITQSKDDFINNNEFVNNNVNEVNSDLRQINTNKVDEESKPLEEENFSTKKESERPPEETVNISSDVPSQPLVNADPSSSPVLVKLVDEPAEADDEQREVKVVKKQVKKESKVETQNGNHNEDNDVEADLTVKLPTKKSAAKTETKVEVVKKVLPDGTVEETKKTITKTTIDGKTEIKTKIETRTIPKDEESEEEIEEEENEEAVVEEVEEAAEEEVEEPTTVIVKKTTVVNEPEVKENGHTDGVIKTEEKSESTTTTTKKVVVVQKQESEEEEEEEEEEEIEEPVVIEKPKESVAQKPPSPKPEPEQEEEEEEVEEVVEKEVEVKEEKQEVEEVVVESKEDKPSPPEKEVEEEEEYEEAESKEEEQLEKVPEPENPKEQPEDDESEYTEEEYESEPEEPAKEAPKQPAPEEIKETPIEKPKEESEEEQKEEIKVESKEEEVEKVINIEVKQEPQEKQEQPQAEPEHKVPLREPSVPLEKVEDVEIKPLSFTPGHETVTKSHTENTEIITNSSEKPAGTLSTQTEYNRIENIVTVNRTTKTLDHSYDQVLQHGVPTVKTYFAPGRERVSTSPQPSRPYQPVYPPEPQPERRHSLLLERLSMERQMPSSDIYQNTNSYQYSNQSYEQQRQWSQEPQSEVVNVSNVKPSTISKNQQWYQQSRQENVIYNNVSSAPPRASSVQPQWSQPPSQPQPAPQPQYQTHLQPQPQIQPQPQPQPQNQSSYNDTIQDTKTSSNIYQQNSYSSYTPKPTSWGSNISDTLPSINTQPSQYSFLNKETSNNYQNTAQTQQYSSSYVPPPWEQDSSYVADNSNQNYYQPPPASTFTPPSNQSWKPTPAPAKFSKPPPTSYVPPKPNQSFVAPVTVEPPKQPGRKTYYSEYERRYITVPESTYIPSETKFQPQPDPSPQYYYDNNEPAESVEPQWRRELREFTEKTSQTQTQTEQTSVNPPWEEDAKYAKSAPNTYTPTPTWSQTLRPNTWRERSFESEYVGSQDWKSNTLGRGRPLSTYKGPEVIPERTRGVSVDRYNPSSYQSPVPAEHPPVQTHILNAPTSPQAMGYHNPNVPAYHARASAEPRDQPVSYRQPRHLGESRNSPFQSRSFKYLQWITGTED